MKAKQDKMGGKMGSSRIVSAALRSGLGISGAAVGLSLGAAIAHRVEAGHTIAGGTCHQAKGTPLMCRTNYGYRSPNPGVPGGYMLVRDIAQWSGGTPEYDLLDWPLFQAEQNWTYAAGPQDVNRSARTNDTWNYVDQAYDPSGTIKPGLLQPLAVTYLCNQAYVPICDYVARTIDIQWSAIYVNPALNSPGTTQWTAVERTTLLAHEMGHAFGLDHHTDTQALMHPHLNENSLLQGPQSIDLGSRTDCRGTTNVPSDQRGIRCIYGWYETPTPTAVPTATNTPVPPPTATPGGK